MRIEDGRRKDKMTVRVVNEGPRVTMVDESGVALRLDAAVLALRAGATLRDEADGDEKSRKMARCMMRKVRWYARERSGTFRW